MYKNSMLSKIKQFSNNSKLLNEVRYRITPFVISNRKGVFLFDDCRFLKLNLNCRGDTCYGYVNMEETRVKGRIYVSKLNHLPFLDNEAKLIFVDFEPMKKKSDLLRIFKEWARVIIPNGILMMDNIELTSEVVLLLNQAGFERVFFEFQKDLPAAFFIYSPKEDFYKEKEFYRDKGDKKLIISKENITGSEKIRIEDLDFDKESLHEVKLLNVLEYIQPKCIQSFLIGIKDFIKPGGELEVLVKRECFEEEGKYISFFDKSNLAQHLTEIGFLFRKLEFQGDSIRALVEKRKTQKKPGIKIERKKRVCAIGQYLMKRYNELGFGWDEIPRAMDELDIDYLLLDGTRNMDKKALQKAILDYRPDYILLILKETVPLLFDIILQLKKMGTKVLYWFSDPEQPLKQDLSSAIDVMFLTNRGQLDEYREAYSLKRVYYMPQGISPYSMYRRNIPEIFDVGFTGAVSKVPLHSTRRKIFDEIGRRYIFVARNNVRNNIPEFYSQSKIVLGGSDFDYELYTSNRFYVALGCGACYLTKKFKSIELLAENRKHMLWFENQRELFDILDYYVTHDSERSAIRKRAEKWALERHTYAHRIKNMLDIAEGKTEKFYGFI